MTNISSQIEQSDPTPQTDRRRDIAALVFFAVLIVAVTMTGILSRTIQSTEAIHRAMVARDLLAGLSRGRQGLIGSPTMAPLPTLALSLLSIIPYVYPAAWSGAVIAGGSTLFLCLYGDHLWSREGISPWLRYPALACIVFLPPVAMSIESGQTTMLFVALAVGGWGFLTCWLRQFDLRDLAYAALLLGLCVGVRYQAAFLVAIALILVVVASAVEHHSRSLLEGTGITFALPAAYVILLWLGGNWLILGNPLFFLRGLAHSLRIGSAGLQAILTANCEWTVLGAVGLLVLSVPAAGLFSSRPTGGKLRHAAGFIGLLGALGIVLISGASAGIQMRDTRIARAVAELEERYPNGSFIVTGYEGYTFQAAAGDDPERAWLHMMHLEDAKLQRILEDFEGREVYLLVNTERTVERWQNLGLEWRGPHSRIPENFIYVEKIGPWVVFEVIRKKKAGTIAGSSGDPV